MNNRRRFLAAAAAVAATLAAPIAHAHHGPMPWNKEEVIILDGFVTEEMDGFPHWEINIRADGVDWVVDVGDDFTLERAGLKPDGSDFTVGRKVIIHGYRPLMHPDLKRLQPIMIIIDGVEYDIRLHGEE